MEAIELELEQDSLEQNGLEREKPIHRAMICLYVEGHTIKDIASRLGYSPQRVSQVLKQPWAKVIMREMLHAAGAEAIYNFLKGQAADSLLTITELRDNPNVPPATRLAASNSLLDRLLGKPTQRVETYSTNLNVSSEDAMEMEAELQRLREEERRLLGQGSKASE